LSFLSLLPGDFHSTFQRKFLPPDLSHEDEETRDLSIIAPELCRTELGGTQNRPRVSVGPKPLRGIQQGSEKNRRCWTPDAHRLQACVTNQQVARAGSTGLQPVCAFFSNLLVDSATCLCRRPARKHPHRPWGKVQKERIAPEGRKAPAVVGGARQAYDLPIRGVGRASPARME